MNTAPWIAKDGVTDANLMRAARDMFEALDAIKVAIWDDDSRTAQQVRCIAADAYAKARGEA